MFMGRLLPLAAVAVTLLLAAVSTASAATPADRAAAKSFAAAAGVLAKETGAAIPDTLVETQRASLDCHLVGVRRAREAGVAPTAIINASLEGLAIARSIINLTAIGSLEAFTKKLDRVRTSDPALRAGRTAWKAYLTSMRVYTTLSFPTDICPRVNAWVDRGGTGKMFPNLDFTAVNREMNASAKLATHEARIERAAERMQSLGQRRSRADRFTVAKALARQIEVERSIVEPYGVTG